MTRVMAAVAGGLADVIRSPLLIAGALVVTLAAALPFAAIVGRQLEDALANQPPIALGSGEIDADWWSEFRAHATGLAATFTPTVIGFAAPLDNLSALLDATPRPVILVLPVMTAMIVWAWFWGAALTRLHGPRACTSRTAIAAGFARLPRFLVISACAAVVQLALYFTVHPLLFKGLYEQLIGDDTPEAAAFATRVICYLIFGGLIVSVSLVADYARIAQVVEQPATVMATLRRSIEFMWRRAASVFGVFAVVALLLVLLLVLYGAVEIFASARVRGWRGVAVGQAYIVGRLVIRLTSAASELRLFKTAG